MKAVYLKVGTPDAFADDKIVQLAFEVAAASPGVLRMSALRDSIAGRSHQNELLADALKAEELGIHETPSFVVGKYLISGAPSAEALKQVVERALKELP